MKQQIELLYSINGKPNAARFTAFKSDLMANGDTPAVTVDTAVTNGVSVTSTVTTAFRATGTKTTGFLVSGTTTTGVSIGTATTGITLTGTYTTGLNITGSSTTAISIGTAGTGISIGVCTTAISVVSPVTSTSSGRFDYTQDNATAATIQTSIKGIMRTLVSGDHTAGNICGTSGETVISSTRSVTGGYVYGVSGQVTLISTASYAGPANSYCAGVNARLNNLNGTGSFTSGHIACVSANIYGINSGTSSSVNGIYIEHAGGGIINSFIQMFGKSTYVFDFASNTHNQMALVGTCATNTVNKGWLKILVEGTVRYIPLSETVS